MALSANHQWELADRHTPLILFGTVDTGYQTAEAPDLGTRSVRVTEFPGVREDGRGFGKGYDDGLTLTFEVNVLSDDWTTQSDRLDALKRAWTNRDIRQERGGFASLSCRNAGRDRVTYGRPNRFAEADADLTHEGYTRVVMDFDTFDGKFYDLPVKSETIGIVPPSTPGITTPIIVTGTDPNTVAFQTDPIDAEALPGAVTVDGDETWAWITIHGPVTDPVVGLGDFEVALNTTIGPGQFAVLDPRPWHRRARLYPGGGNLAGRFTYRTPRLADWLLAPGAHELTYRGTDPTGTSTVTVEWREAHHHP